MTCLGISKKMAINMIGFPKKSGVLPKIDGETQKSYRNWLSEIPCLGGISFFGVRICTWRLIPVRYVVGITTISKP